MELSAGAPEVTRPSRGTSQVVSQTIKANPTGRLRFDETLEKSLPKIESHETPVVSGDTQVKPTLPREPTQRKDSQKSIREYFFKT
jgi:hypothetical protein